MKTDALQSAFETWWDNEGSAMPPMPHEDSEMFARRVSELAWHNGAFAQRWVVGPAYRPVQCLHPENSPEVTYSEEE